MFVVVKKKTGRPALEDSSRRVVQIQTYVTQGEAARLRQLAGKQPLSAWLRDLLAPLLDEGQE